MKKNILIFNGYYFPAKRYGGPATSIRNMIDSCASEFNFYIVVMNHDFGSETKLKGIAEGWNEVGMAKVMYVDEHEYTKSNIRKWIDEVRADALYLGGIYSIRNFKYVSVAKERKIPVLIPPRGELNPNAIKQKGYKKIPFLFCCRMLKIYSHCFFHVTSEEEGVGVKKWLKIDENKIILLPNLPSVQVNDFKYEKSNILKIVSISRICTSKNISSSIKIVLDLNMKVIFDIYGPIEDEKYWDECKKLMSKNSENISFNYCGELDSDDVANTFQKYDCFLFPTLTENFGHSIVEALMNKCPVILSKNTTPWNDLENSGGFVVDLDNLNQFKVSLEKIYNMSSEEYDIFTKKGYNYIFEKIDYNNLKRKYQTCWNKIILKNLTKKQRGE